jgi:hypothetical protein
MTKTIKVIEKINKDGDTQTFEIITSRKELADFLHTQLHEWIYSEYAKDWHPDSIFDDTDTTICYYDKNNKFTWISEGETVKRPNISNITKLLSTNGSGTIIYGDIDIVYDEKDDYWRAEI